MKTKEELQEIKKEVERLNKKLAELTEEELEHVCGGIGIPELEPIEQHSTLKGKGHESARGFPETTIW